MPKMLKELCAALRRSPLTVIRVLSCNLCNSISNLVPHMICRLGTQDLQQLLSNGVALLLRERQEDLDIPRLLTCADLARLRGDSAEEDCSEGSYL